MFNYQIYDNTTQETIKDRLRMAVKHYLISRCAENAKDTDIGILRAKQFYVHVEALENEGQYKALICALLKSSSNLLASIVVNYLDPTLLIQNVYADTNSVSASTIQVTYDNKRVCWDIAVKNSCNEKFNSNHVQESEYTQEIILYHRHHAWGSAKYKVIYRDKRREMYKSWAKASINQGSYTNYANTLAYPDATALKDISIELPKFEITGDNLIKKINNSLEDYKKNHVAHSFLGNQEGGGRVKRIETMLRESISMEQALTLFAAILSLTAGQLSKLLIKQLICHDQIQCYAQHCPINLLPLVTRWHGPCLLGDETPINVTNDFFSALPLAKDSDGLKFADAETIIRMLPRLTGVTINMNFVKDCQSYILGDSLQLPQYPSVSLADNPAITMYGNEQESRSNAPDGIELAGMKVMDPK